MTTHIAKLAGAELVRISTTDFLFVYIHEAIRANSRSYRFIVRMEASGHELINAKLQDCQTFPSSTLHAIVGISKLDDVRNHSQAIKNAIRKIGKQLAEAESLANQNTVQVLVGG